MQVPVLDLTAMHAELDFELNNAWQEVTKSNQFIGGKYVEQFEEAWATYCGVDHCVGVASGTAALELALSGLGVGAGDEVIVPANTFVATAMAVRTVGATPVFIDVDPSTLLMTAKGVQDAISPRTAAVIPVHLYGQPVDMDAICEVASAAGISVVEDAAQAHGATWHGKRVGSLGDVACFSFYPGKNLGALGDAGAVVTNNPSLAERIRLLGNYGRGESRYHHILAGTNSRLDGLQAALLSVKLKRLDKWNEERQRVAATYRTALADLPVHMVENAPGAVSTYHLAVIQTRSRDTLQENLATMGVSTAIHYPIPCHLQPAFAVSDVPSLPVAEEAAGQILSLPMYPHLSESQIMFVAEAISTALADLRLEDKIAV